jgi:hypothetical protein
MTAGVAPTYPRHCERSEAIHSFFARRDGLLRGACHRARIRATRWLAMTVIHHTFAFSRRGSPEAYINLSPNGGRRERRVLAAPAVSRAKMHIASAHEHTGTVGASRHSLHNGFTAYAVLSPATNSSCHRHRRIEGFANPVGPAKTSADLAPATGARTTRFCRTQPPVFAKRRRRALASFVLRDDDCSREPRPAISFHTRRCRVHRIPPQRS